MTIPVFKVESERDINGNARCAFIVIHQDATLDVYLDTSGEREMRRLHPGAMLALHIRVTPAEYRRIIGEKLGPDSLDAADADDYARETP